MKLAAFASLFCVALTACASAPKPDSASPSASSASLTSSAALTAAEAEPSSGKPGAEEWAEKRVAAEAESAKKAARSGDQQREALDPLAMGSELEESSIPNIDRTPKGQVRAKSPGELNAALFVLKSESSVEGAVKKLTQRLGKPSWTEAPKGAENAKRYIWIAGTGATCQRLVLEADGSVEVEPAPSGEWRMLTASARQNPCTGEIRRGIEK